MKVTPKEKREIYRLMPDLLLKDVLCFPYEQIKNCHVFKIEEDWRAQELKNANEVVFADEVDVFEKLLDESKNSNILISYHLINKPLLEQILQKHSLEKNVFWANI